MGYPYGIAVDGLGNLFIADQNNHRIRKVDINGVITTVAGTGNKGFSGDGGAATDAMLNYPNGVAVDKSGTLFITDTYNQRIRKVDTNGIITTIAGDGTAGYSGNNVAATSAELNYPITTAVDRSGNIFIADAKNYRVRKVSPAGIITTVAGTGVQAYGSADGGAAASTQLAYPIGVAIDGNNDLLIADGLDHRIRKVDTNGIITTYAGNGAESFGGDGRAATSARLNTPTRVAVDKNGNVFIADSHNHRIRKVDTNGIITTYAGTSPGGFVGDGGAATSALLNNPVGVALDNQGNLFIADANNWRIRKVDANGIITTVAGNGEAGFSGDGGPALAARFSNPNGLAVDANRNLFIVDLDNQRVRKVSAIPGVGRAIVSVQSGDWLTASTWDCNCVPGSNDTATISTGHVVTVGQSVQVSTLTVYGQIQYTVAGQVSFQTNE